MSEGLFYFSALPNVAFSTPQLTARAELETTISCQATSLYPRNSVKFTIKLGEETLLDQFEPTAYDSNADGTFRTSVQESNIYLRSDNGKSLICEVIFNIGSFTPDPQPNLASSGVTVECEYKPIWKRKIQLCTKKDCIVKR